MISTERIQQLIQKGESVIRTHTPNPSNMIGFTTLNEGTFEAWRTQVLNYLQSNLPINNQYILSFGTSVKFAYVNHAEQGVGILKSLLEDVDLDLLSNSNDNNFDPINPILSIFDRFHNVVRKLRHRYENRETLNISDEYDVQDLLHALLSLYFNDIWAEE